MKKILSPALPAFFLSTVCYSSMAAAFEVQHESHVHGEGELNIVIEGTQLQAELKLPMMDVVGFEHEARTYDDKAKVKQALQNLEDVYQLIKLPDAALCLKGDVDVHLGGDHDEHDHGKEHSDHEEHAHHEKEHEHGHHEKEHDHHKEHAHHEKEHDHHGHDEHDHGDGHTEDHQDVHAHYQFKCVKPELLNQIELGYFAKFPSIAHLKVNLLSDQAVISQELSSETPVLKIK
ncbi:DUF2796 domain-containing protein [Neptuniibacter sp.]|uniref:ZrgA family zinc uptake protein n=1 Tax=Neptuniibacter sp. TaxID=1962643 RepID=UPI00260BDDBE|nr:DUF2796 domain-containing protein [Neptuniibacter sp.]MCP4596300.1 DUF2796 domain-containing protein [Neptuniibacter sp.]